MTGQQQQQSLSTPLFDFSLMVELVEPKSETERLGVLDGLRKYVKQDPVLLVGKPGSGKSTALKRLLKD